MRNAINPLPLQGEGQGGGQSMEITKHTPPPVKSEESAKGGVTRNAQKKTINNAKRLRKNLTETEQSLWYHLRAQRFFNYKFRRQHAIGEYVVDFICLKSKLIIEFDGGQHGASTSYDVARTRFLESLGFQVLRFWNNEVNENKEAVLQSILTALSPILSLKGEGVQYNPVSLKGEGVQYNPLPLQGEGQGGGQS